MRVIWKFPFSVQDEFVLPLYRVYQILHVDVQHGSPPRTACLWAIVNPDSEQITVPFRVLGTGHQFDPEEVGEFIATWQDPPFVWHLFRGR